jgi:hypothetical protein
MFQIPLVPFVISYVAPQRVLCIKGFHSNVLAKNCLWAEEYKTTQAAMGTKERKPGFSDVQLMFSKRNGESGIYFVVEGKASTELSEIR